MRSFFGENKRHSYFEGWYFKQQTQSQTVAFIPALHMDAQGRRSASIQVVTDNAALYAQFPFESFRAARHGLYIRIGDNCFSQEGVSVDIAENGFNVKGELRFGKLLPLKSDIMGPFRYVPLLQCRHSVWSILHSVSGMLTVNGSPIPFENASGYIEGDRGSSFPQRYVWTQCGLRGDIPCSVMLSVADIPFAGLRFTGIIGYAYWGGVERRIATYLGAKPVRIDRDVISVRQGGCLLQADLLESRPKLLRAPVNGGMTRAIRESPSCRVRYRFYDDGRELFDFVSDRAGFEYEYGAD